MDKLDDVKLVDFQSASLGYGRRTLWRDLSFDVSPGEFVVVLGPNGSGKTSMFKALLNQIRLNEGKISKSANLELGYVAQLRSFSPNLPLRGRDFIKMGLDGKDYCLSLFSKIGRKRKRFLIDQAIAEVNAQQYANYPLSRLSGGERQRIRIAQALVSEPQLLLLDEPLVSLDLTNQQIICNILEHQKKTHHTAVLMITHEINPVINMVDKVIYFANGQAAVGRPEDILTSEVLSDLYKIPVEVIHKNNKIFILVENHLTTNIQHIKETIQ